MMIMIINKYNLLSVVSAMLFIIWGSFGSLFRRPEPPQKMSLVGIGNPYKDFLI